MTQEEYKAIVERGANYSITAGVMMFIVTVCAFDVLEKRGELPTTHLLDVISWAFGLGFAALVLVAVFYSIVMWILHHE